MDAWSIRRQQNTEADLISLSGFIGHRLIIRRAKDHERDAGEGRPFLL